MTLKQATAEYRRARRRYLKTSQLDDRRKLTEALLVLLRAGGKVAFKDVNERAA